MPGTLYHLGDVPVLWYVPDEPVLAGEQDANDLIAQAWQHEARWVAVPVTGIAADFFRLRTGVAGQVVQKFVNYRIGLAVVGDLTAHLDGSRALTDFVRECNQGSQTWFVADLEELHRRLAG
ncbi:MAG TPA: DUF4180 domain-containing protein [Pseudonocardiaceae bacterium]